MILKLTCFERYPVQSHLWMKQSKHGSQSFKTVGALSCYNAGKIVEASPWVRLVGQKSEDLSWIPCKAVCEAYTKKSVHWSCELYNIWFGIRKKWNVRIVWRPFPYENSEVTLIHVTPKIMKMGKLVKKAVQVTPMGKSCLILDYQQSKWIHEAIP